MNSTVRILVFGILFTMLAAACTAPLTLMTPTPPAAPETAADMANPASVNCIDEGGTLQIEQRPDGGEYGVCVFEDNMQCEEWALMRGDCPSGGVKVTGYATDAARFCAITGGEYAVTDESSEQEQGTCTLPGGTVCDVYAYFEGTCSEE